MGRMKELWLKQHEDAIAVENERYNAGLVIIEQAEKALVDWEAWMKEEQVQETIKQITLEEVRVVLAEKSREGFTKEVRELLIKHGANKLSEVDPYEYAALLAEAAELNHAS